MSALDINLQRLNLQVARLLGLIKIESDPVAQKELMAEEQRLRGALQRVTHALNEQVHKFDEPVKNGA